MKFPKGKGFDLACGAVITVVLNKVIHDDLVTLTGTFLGEAEENRHHRRIDGFHEFILIQLTCPFCEKGGLEIPEGTFVAVNIEQILFTIPGKTYQEDNWCENCHNKKNNNKQCHDKCFDNQDENHIININCNRDDDKKS